MMQAFMCVKRGRLGVWRCGTHPLLKSFRLLLLLVFLLVAGAASQAQVLVQIGQNFTGSTFGIDTSLTPPDCNGAAGPLHYVELINGRFSVYDKTNGSRILTTNGASFWANSGITLNAGILVSDPRIVFDPLDQRWFASAIDFDPSNQASNRFLLAVSTSADPTGSWTGLAFLADPDQGNFADFPTLGMDEDGLYLAAHMFSPGGAPIGETLVSLPKKDLLADTPTADNRTPFALLDSAAYGSILQPNMNFTQPGRNGKVLAVGDLGLDHGVHSTLAAFDILNASGQGPATLTPPTSISVDPYYAPINPFQPDGNDTLDDGDARFSASVYQVGGILYAVHGVEVDNQAAIRWYEISPADFSVLQSGTITDPVMDLFYPSIAVNPSGTVVICFNGCSTGTFVSAFAVVGETVGGVLTFGSPILLQAGLASYQFVTQGNVSRWGDYSSTCVDPADPNRFWTIQMYPTNSNTWCTQITELLTAVPSLSIASAETNILLSWPGTAIPFDLESTDSLESPHWTPVSGPSSASNGVVSVQLPAIPGPQFFRLRKL